MIEGLCFMQRQIRKKIHPALEYIKGFTGAQINSGNVFSHTDKAFEQTVADIKTLTRRPAQGKILPQLVSWLEMHFLQILTGNPQINLAFLEILYQGLDAEVPQPSKSENAPHFAPQPQHLLSDKEVAFRRLPLLRTVHASFPAHGSSRLKAGFPTRFTLLSSKYYSHHWSNLIGGYFRFRRARSSK